MRVYEMGKWGKSKKWKKGKEWGVELVCKMKRKDSLFSLKNEIREGKGKK